MVKHACRNIYLSIYVTNNHIDFLIDVSIIVIYKTDLSNPLKRKNHWEHILHILKTFAPPLGKIAEYVQRCHHNIYYCFGQRFLLGCNSISS